MSLGLKAVFLADDRGFTPAFEAVTGLKPVAGDLPLVLNAGFGAFERALREHTLTGGVFYKRSPRPLRPMQRARYPEQVIGIRREDKNRWERRAPLTPEHVAQLVKRHDLALRVQPSSNSAFPDQAYRDAGAGISEDLEGCEVVLGVKEIPVEKIRPGVAYAYFAHVIKGQSANMPALRRLLDLGCTLIEYERIVDEDGKRLIFFGRHAGYAGMIDTFWALGRRLAWEGIGNAFAAVRLGHEYADPPWKEQMR